MSYNYFAYVTSVYDGDTITVDIDLGFGILFKNQKIRLYGIDTPEIRGEERTEGLKSKEYLQNLILNKNIILETIKDKKCKYGRYLGIIHLDGNNINEIMMKNSMAKKYSC